MQGLTQPTILLKPFADSGDKNSIPVTNSDVSNPQLADLTNGFPVVTGKKPEDGGLPPERKDFNGLGYLTTSYDYFYQAGGTFTYNATIASAIGGYPQNARLWYTDANGNTTVLRSTKNDNTDNFVTTPSYIGTSWVPEIPALGWDNYWTGVNTFSGSVVLGSSATATTPSSATDNSTKVPTTAWVRNHRCKTAASTTSTASIDAPAYVVENYRNGGSWYRVYSDGWIEQGSGFAYPTSDTDKQVNLIKAFANTDYCVLLGGTAQSNANTAEKAYVASKSTSSFTAHFRGQEAQTINWVAFGQGAIPS